MPLRSPFHDHFRLSQIPSEIRNFYIHLFCSKISEALMLVAMPLRLYEFGQTYEPFRRMFSAEMERGIFSVLLFYILSKVFSLVLTKPLSGIFRKIGITRAMALGQVLLISQLFLFSFLDNNPWLFFLGAAIRGLGIFIYWVGYYTYFSGILKPRHVGEEVSTLEFLGRLATIISPLISALLITNVGYASVFIVGAVFGLASLIGLFTLPNFPTTLKWRWNDFFTALRRHDYQKTVIGMAGYAWEEIGLAILWPVFLYIAFGTAVTVGYVLAGASFFSLIVIYLTGLSFDSNKIGNRLRTAAGIGLGMLWVPRTFLSHLPFMLVFTEAIDRLLAGVYGTLFYVSLFAQAQNEDRFVFYVNREVILSFTLGGGFLLGVVLLFAGWNWSLVFLSFIVGTLASLGFRGDKL